MMEKYRSHEQESEVPDMNIQEITSALTPTGNPDAGISIEKRLADGSLSEHQLAACREVLMQPDCFVAVSEKDCGCIDGRVAHKVTFHDADGNVVARKKDALTITHHNRAKVAGGGYGTQLAAWIGAFGHGESMNDDLRAVGAHSTDSGVICGAHTGDHETESSTDCGAIDKTIPILRRAVENKDALLKNLEAALSLMREDFDQETATAVLKNWHNACKDQQYVASDHPEQRMRIIRDEIIPHAQEQLGSKDHPVAVIKQLKGDHGEVAIVLNIVEGTTLSQRKYAQSMRNRLELSKDDVIPEAFCVDLWRVQELADTYRNNELHQNVLHAAVAFQLATDNQLTDGTLAYFAATS